MLYNTALQVTEIKQRDIGMTRGATMLKRIKTLGFASMHPNRMHRSITNGEENHFSPEKNIDCKEVYVYDLIYTKK